MSRWLDFVGWSVDVSVFGWRVNTGFRQIREDALAHYEWHEQSLSVPPITCTHHMHMRMFDVCVCGVDCDCAHREHALRTTATTTTTELYSNTAPKPPDGIRPNTCPKYYGTHAKTLCTRWPSGNVNLLAYDPWPAAAC